MALKRRMRMASWGFFGLMSCATMLAFNILGAGIHLYVTWYAYNASGIIAAAVTFILPGMSALFWMFPISSAAGSWWNMYTAATLLFCVLYILMLIFTSLTESAEHDTET